MINRVTALASIALLTCSLTASAQLAPGIGLYFDENATATVSGYEIMVPTQAYICILQAEMMVSGAAFKLEVPINALAAGAVYPAGLAIGDIGQGVEVGLTTPIPGFSGVVLLTTLQIIVTSGEPAVLLVVAHPDYATPLVADSLGNLVEAVGTGGTLTRGLPVGAATWSELKTMFR